MDCLVAGANFLLKVGPLYHNKIWYVQLIIFLLKVKPSHLDLSLLPFPNLDCCCSDSP